MKVSEGILQHIKNEIKKLKYGKVIIELNETSNKIDVITENRERFYKNGENNEDYKRG